MSRFINCEVCQTEGRILTNDGGPDDVDHGVCPECGGECCVEVDDEPATLEDLETAHGLPDYECENCIGMIEHGCYCKAMGAIAPGGPLARPLEPATEAGEMNHRTTDCSDNSERSSKT